MIMYKMQFYEIIMDLIRIICLTKEPEYYYYIVRNIFIYNIISPHARSLMQCK